MDGHVSATQVSSEMMKGSDDASRNHAADVDAHAHVHAHARIHCCWGEIYPSVRFLKSLEMLTCCGPRAKVRAHSEIARGYHRLDGRYVNVSCRNFQAAPVASDLDNSRRVRYDQTLEYDSERDGSRAGND